MRRASRLGAVGLLLAGSVLLAGSLETDAAVAHSASSAGPGWADTSREWSAGSQQEYAVAISGNIAVGGAPGADHGQGVAYIWIRVGGAQTWRKAATLPDPRHAKDDYYAWAVAVSSTKSGTYLAIGGNDNNGNPDRVYIYTGSGASWHLQATIDDPGPNYLDMYGDNLAISPSTLVVGASCGGDDSGAAYIYDHDGKRWVRKKSIKDPRHTADDFFGQAVAVSGDRVMIGEVGYVYVYTAKSGKDWKQTDRITHPGSSDQSFGQSVALAGTTAVIASPGVPPIGAAYVYRLSGTTWSRKQELTRTGGGGEFAWAVAMSGSELLVGMPIGGTPNCGAAFAYKQSGTQFTMQKEIMDPDSSCTSNDRFGNAVALASTYGIFGAPGANGGHGANYELPVP
jgi:hypothetical protein